MVNFLNLNIDHNFISPGGRGTPLYKPCGYVLPHREEFLRRFGLKTGIHNAHFGLESGIVFEGTRRVKKYLSFHPN